MSAARCSSCGALITWALTPSGRSIPLDPDAPDGNLFATVDRAGRTHVRPRLLDAEPGPDETPAVSHFATCPNAKLHRRPR